MLTVGSTITRWTLVVALVLSVSISDAIEFGQKAIELEADGADGLPRFGMAVALSDNGHTLAVGGDKDGKDTGATWIFVRNPDLEGRWEAQGDKLVGADGKFQTFQGGSVSLSGDGDTLAVGAKNDNLKMGATWIFQRDGGIWTQGGQKLVAPSEELTGKQGCAVALSANGKVLAVGALGSGKGVGATWIFRRTVSDGGWVPESDPVIGTDSIGGSKQGSGVALSRDGNTLAVGGYEDDGGVGATWIFKYIALVGWKQQAKLVGDDINGNVAFQGFSVALSADGLILAVGEDATKKRVQGGAWIFRAVDGTGAWNQVGDKLVGSGKGGTKSGQGYSVALDGMGTLLAVGDHDARGKDVKRGATWLFQRNPAGAYLQLGGPLTRDADLESLAGSAVDLSRDGCTLAVGASSESHARETQLGGMLLYPASSDDCPDYPFSQPTETSSNRTTLLASILGVIAVSLCCVLTCFLVRRWKHKSKLPQVSSEFSEKDGPALFSAAHGGLKARHPPDTSKVPTATLDVHSTWRAPGTSTGASFNLTTWSMDPQSAYTASTSVSDNPLDFLKAQLDSLHSNGTLILNRFQLGDRQDRRVGGRGVVQFATVNRSRRNAKSYAIKFFLDRNSFDAECRQLKKSELWHIMPVIEDVLDNDDGIVSSLGCPLPPMVIVEKGESLDEWQRRCKANFDNSMSIILQLVECVVAMHSAGVAHRDLKPANVISYPLRNAWNLIDFGEAADIGSVAPVACTISYAAPETMVSIMNGERTAVVDPSVDAWALGIIAYELFTRSRVFPSSDRQLVQDMLTGNSLLEWEDTEEAACIEKLQCLGWMQEGVLSLLRRDPNERATLSDVLASWMGHLQHDLVQSD